MLSYVRVRQSIRCCAWQAVGKLAPQLSADSAEARLYKMVVYKEGSFFLPHRDTQVRATGPPWPALTRFAM
jgi:hypothetical protein